MTSPLDKCWRPEAPPLQELANWTVSQTVQKRQLGRGWGLSNAQIKWLHDRAKMMRNMDGVLRSILETLTQDPDPHPNPSPKGEGLSFTGCTG